MSQILTLHPQNPQTHLLRKAVAVLKSGGIIVYPTDSGYALACHLGDKKALDKIRMIRKLDQDHYFTLVCRDLSEISTYAVIDDGVYRILKTYLPGPYTFILKATKETPRRLQNFKRKTIGIRVPNHIIAHALLDMLDEPLMSTTLTIPGENVNILRAQTICDILGNQINLVLDGGDCGLSPTSVIDLSGDSPVIVREGKGDIDAFR
jgi:tRNA threonylcarbamoyl adenosine modification protein (Sua5/YciO/YrdC/YwlC family)